MAVAIARLWCETVILKVRTGLSTYQNFYCIDIVKTNSYELTLTKVLGISRRW